jgi:hypothetical protein
MKNIILNTHALLCINIHRHFSNKYRTISLHASETVYQIRISEFAFIMLGQFSCCVNPEYKWMCNLEFVVGCHAQNVKIRIVQMPKQCTANHSIAV